MNDENNPWWPEDVLKQFMAYDAGQSAVTTIGHLRAILLPVVKPIDGSDYNCEPLGGGRFRMIPSRDVVNKTEKDTRLAKRLSPARD